MSCYMKWGVASAAVIAFGLIASAPASAAPPYDASFKALGQRTYHQYDRGYSYGGYASGYAAAPAERRSYSAVPDVPPAPNGYGAEQPMADGYSDGAPMASGYGCDSVPYSDQRSYSVEPMAPVESYQPMTRGYSGSYRSRSYSQPAYTLPRAMRW